MMALAQGLGFTRMSIPFMIGTIVTPARDRAMVPGYAMHCVNGVLSALIYALVFDGSGRTGWAPGWARRTPCSCSPPAWRRFPGCTRTW